MLEWTEIFVVHRHKQKLEYISHHVEGQTITVETKKGSKVYHVQEVLKAKEDTTICPNTKENVTLLLKDWEAFVDKKSTIIFVNVNAHEHWIISPKVHSMIAEPPYNKGIMALFESVPAC